MKIESLFRFGAPFDNAIERIHQPPSAIAFDCRDANWARRVWRELFQDMAAANIDRSRVSGCRGVTPLMPVRSLKRNEGSLLGNISDAILIKTFGEMSGRLNERDYVIPT